MDGSPCTSVNSCVYGVCVCIWCVCVCVCVALGLAILCHLLRIFSGNYCCISYSIKKKKLVLASFLKLRISLRPSVMVFTFNHGQS